jgi:alpha-galactosidase
VIVPPASTGNAFVSDLPWLRTENGWGPVERGTSNGEQNAGDGHPITIGGVPYPKGIGTHAPSLVEFYAGGHCTTVTTEVGVDDEQGANGTVGFEIWADARKVADSGTLAAGMPAKPLTASIAGATLIRLITNNGGNGNSGDHGDWANTTITCG